MSEQDKPGTSRRKFMVGGAAAAIGAAAGTAASGRRGKVTDSQARLLDKVTAAATANASLGDVKHIVILMQENRSFDHIWKVVRTQLVSPHARVRAYARWAAFSA